MPPTQSPPKTYSFSQAPGHTILPASPPTAKSWPVECATVFEYLVACGIAELTATPDKYCSSLGVSIRALRNMEVGFYRDKSKTQFPGIRIPEADAVGGNYWVVPVRNARGVIIGVLLISVDGEHCFLSGNHGLIYPANWNRRSRLLILTPCALDVLAGATLSIDAVAVTGPAALTQLIQMLQAWPVEFATIAVGHHEWARHTCQVLADRRIAHAMWNHVPDGFPDLYSLVERHLCDFDNAKRVFDLDAVPTSKMLKEFGLWLVRYLKKSCASPIGNTKQGMHEPPQPYTLPLSGSVVDALVSLAPIETSFSESADFTVQQDLAAIEGAEMVARNSMCCDTTTIERWVAVRRNISESADRKERMAS